MLILLLLLKHCVTIKAITKSRLLLVSFDGFRYDYLDKVETPNFDRLISTGLRAQWIQDAFISKTFPNHYTIVTGLYEESHGIIANNFYDPYLNETFSLKKTGAKWWSVGAEPIWVTNKLQCQHCRSGVYFWPGSEAEIKKIRPDHYKKYDQDVPMQSRIDTVVDWFKSDPSLNLALLYFHEPDHTAHWYGPNSTQVADMIRQCDNYTGYLLDEIEKAGLSDLNIIITSDHGFTTLKSNETIIVLSDILPSHLKYDVYGGSPVFLISPKDEENQTAINEIYHYLKISKDQKMKVYLREEVPVELHYSLNDRISPIVVAADLGYGLAKDRSKESLWYWKRRGEHGYDNRNMDMHPFFVARGPAFKNMKVRANPFNNVDIYEMMCKILGLTPAPNNGSLARVCGLLTLPCPSDDNFRNFGFWLLTVVGVTVSIIVAAAFVANAVHHRHLRRPPPRSIHPTIPPSPLSSPDEIHWDDDSEVESVFVNVEGIRRSKWRRWSSNWKRKWQNWRHQSRRMGECDALLVTFPAEDDANPSAQLMPSDSESTGLPSHLLDAFKRSPT